MCGHMALGAQLSFSFGWFAGEGPTQNVTATLDDFLRESKSKTITSVNCEAEFNPVAQST